MSTNVKDLPILPADSVVTMYVLDGILMEVDEYPGSDWADNLDFDVEWHVVTPRGAAIFGSRNRIGGTATWDLTTKDHGILSATAQGYRMPVVTFAPTGWHELRLLTD